MIRIQGSREYALQCHGAGLNIVDVTNPSNGENQFLD
jgi:hypothetical protein